MAAPRYVTEQFSSEAFVESVGAVLFKMSTKEICLVHFHERNEWLLAKGRRNIGESRQQTAIREVQEETGFPCRLLPVTLRTRCTPDGPEVGITPDESRTFENAIEPFMLTHRILPKNAGIKLIWWYIGAVDEDKPPSNGEDTYSARFYGFEEAMATLTFTSDREIVEKAIAILEETHGDRKSLSRATTS